MVKYNCLSDEQSVVNGVRCIRVILVFDLFPFGVEDERTASIRSDEPFDFDQQFLAAEVALEIEQVA